MNAIDGLFDVGVRGLAVLIIASIVVAVLRRQTSAAMRHTIWTASLAALLVLPLLHIALPHWSVAILPVQPSVQTPETFAAPAAPNAIVLPDLDPWSADDLRRVDERLPDVDASARDATISVIDSVSVLEPRTSAIAPLEMHWPALAFVAWLIVAAALIAYRLLDWMRLRRIMRDAKRLSGTRANMLLDQLALRMGLRRKVELIESSAAHVPMTWGAFRLVIALSPGAEDWDEPHLRTVLLHELAHIKRWDYLTQWIADLAVAVWWFNPLAWWVGRAMRIERERACDDIVLEGGVRPSDYADVLLSAVRSLRDSVWMGGVALAMARQTRLEGRLRAILDPARRRGSVRLSTMLAVSAAVMSIAAPLAALRAVQREAQDEAAKQPTTHRAALSNGVMIELIGVAGHPSEESDWWTPSGEAMPAAPYASIGPAAIAGEDQSAYEFVARIEGGQDIGVRWAVPGASAMSQRGAPRDAQDKPIDDLNAAAANLVADRMTVDIRIGIAAGSWRTMVINTPGESASLGVDNGGVNLSPAYEQDGQAVVQASNTLLEKDVRVVAVTTDGRTLPPVSTTGTGVTGVRHHVYHFAIPLAEVKELRFQSRAYEWADFRNVSLRRGFETDVHVQPRAEDEPGQPGVFALTDDPDAPLVVAANRLALRRSIDGRIDWVSLHEVIDKIQNATGVKITVDWDGLAVAGVKPDVPITLAFRSIPADRLLRLAVDQAATRALTQELVFRDDDVLITTRRAAYPSSARKYPIDDLVRMPSNIRHTGAMSASQMDSTQIVAHLIQLIRDTVKDLDGVTVIVDKGVSLRVAAPAYAHREVENLLGQIREAGALEIELTGRMLELPRAALSQLPDALEPVGAGRARMQWLSPQALQIIDRLEAEGVAARLYEPSLTLVNGTPGTWVHGSVTQYICGYRKILEADLQPKYEPIVSLMTEGFRLSVAGTVSRDLEYVTLTIKPASSTMRGPFSTKPFLDAPADLNLIVEEPNYDVAEWAHVTISAANGGTLALEFDGPDAGDGKTNLLILTPRIREAGQEGLAKPNEPTIDRRRAFIVRGRVTDDRGEPMAGVTIAAYAGEGTLRRTGGAESGDDGRYEVRFGPGMLMSGTPLGVGLQAGLISARKEGYFEANLNRKGNLAISDDVERWATESKWYEAVIRPNEPYELNFVMKPAVVIEGRLLDAEGKPMTDHKVWIDGEDLPPGHSVLASATTDAEGRFVFDAVPTDVDWRFSVPFKIPDGGKTKEIDAPVRFDAPGRYGFDLSLRGGPADMTLRAERVTITPTTP